MQSPAFMRLPLLLLLLLGVSAALTKAEQCNVRGELCDMPRAMCNGSNTFWCENGFCNEIIQGENYTCICKEGYSGDHCELKGVQCGNIFCYHKGRCIENEGSCNCPDDWKGSVDCSTPAPTSFRNTTVHPTKEEEDDNSLFAIGFVVFAVLVVGIGITGVVYAVNLLRKQSKAASGFHKVQQVQMQGFIDEDEDEHKPLSKAEFA